jgi:hypothetical protein
MPAGVTPELARAWASAPRGVEIWQTLELAHPLFGVFFLTNAPTPFTVTLETGQLATFQPFPFALVLPTIDGAGQQDLSVTLTNADQAVADAVQLAHADPTTRIVATYRVFLSSLGSAQPPQAPPLRLEFDSVQITEEAVSGVAGRSDTLNRRFPGTWYDVVHFPGLDR